MDSDVLHGEVSCLTSLWLLPFIAYSAEIALLASPAALTPRTSSAECLFACQVFVPLFC